MKLISVNVGGPRAVDWHGRPVQTSIWKDPVEGRVPLRRLNLEGDQQSDLSVHGGPHKAVYLYPVEHYARWARELPEIEFPLGAFGENFTTEGLLEDDVAIGDRFKVGTAELVVTQPRMPCFKLGIRFGRDDMVKRFLRSGRSGYYVAVVREGVVGRGDAIERLSRDSRGVSIADVFALYSRDAGNRALLERVVDHPGLPESWRESFRQRLRALDAGK
ncbi:MAG: MOSC domain-containing protein [Acidobacteriota bacterium]